MNSFLKKIKKVTNFSFLLILAIFIAINFLFSLLYLRIDMTSAKLYSISKATKRVLKDLDDIVLIKCYFTEDLPSYLINLKTTVKDLLAEYQNYSRGNIKIKFLDPNKDENIEQEAKNLGIPTLQFNVYRKDKLEVVNGYMGIVIQYGDETEIIPVIDRRTLPNLEYLLTSKIKKLYSGKEYKIGIYQLEDTPKLDSDLSIFKNHIEENYEIVNLDENSEYKDDLDAVIVLGIISNLPEKQLFYLDQYILHNKGVLILEDGVFVDRKAGLSTTKNESNILSLLKSYGIEIENNLISDISHSNASFNMGFFSIITPYPLWVSAKREMLNFKNPITSELGNVVLPWVSSIKINLKDKKIDNLIMSSNKINIQEDRFEVNPNVIPKTFEDSKPKILALSFVGELKSFYNNKELPDKNFKDFNSKTDKARIIVVSDSDFIQDFFVRSHPDNLIFALNSIDYLLNDISLISIRSKTIQERPLKDISPASKKAIKYLNILTTSILFGIFGIIKGIIRRKSYEKKY